MSFYRHYGKRVFDVTIASFALVVLSPLLIVIAVLVRLRMGTPILFRQERPGLNEKLFRMFKFRTMTDARDHGGNLLPDAQRLMRVGEILRRTSLDELPELINVVLGHMSLVGPRPLLIRYLPYFREPERVRFRVRPGITGLAQINGRNLLSWDYRLQRDGDYVRQLSFATDLKILFETVRCVLRREGYTADPNEIMLDLDAERHGMSEVMQ